LRARARPSTRTAPVSTVKNVAVRAETCWVPILIKIVPLPKPRVATAEKATAQPASPIVIALNLKGLLIRFSSIDFTSLEKRYDYIR
jgi:hypothetical protein